MRTQRTRKGIEAIMIKVVAVIGIILLLIATSYMAYVAIDEQARTSSHRGIRRQ